MRIVLNLFVMLGVVGMSVSSGAEPICDRIRFYPAPGAEQAMVGGKFTGSNVSRREGYTTLVEITTAPQPGNWTELKFDNKRVYRWLRYEGPPGSFGKIAEIEFYAGERRLRGNQFGTIALEAGRGSRFSADDNVKTWFESHLPDGQFVGIDLRDAATAKPPTRTRGYVYCGIVSVPRGATLKAIAYRSGLSDSDVATTTFDELTKSK